MNACVCVHLEFHTHKRFYYLIYFLIVLFIVCVCVCLCMFTSDYPTLFKQSGSINRISFQWKLWECVWDTNRAGFSWIFFSIFLTNKKFFKSSPNSIDCFFSRWKKNQPIDKDVIFDFFFRYCSVHTSSTLEWMNEIKSITNCASSPSIEWNIGHFAKKKMAFDILPQKCDGNDSLIIDPFLNSCLMMKIHTHNNHHHYYCQKILWKKIISDLLIARSKIFFS